MYQCADVSDVCKTSIFMLKGKNDQSTKDEEVK
jgi:hypothetical protein